MGEITKTVIIDVDDKDAKKVVRELDKGLSGLDKGATTAGKGVGRISNAFKGLGVAIKAAGIGLVIAAFAKLSEIFMQNQKVANAFNTAFEAVSIAFNDFVNFVVNNGGKVVGFFKAIFENPLESVKALGRSIKANIIERFESFLDTLGFLASAVKKVFSGDFAGALEDVKAAGKESIDVLTGVNNTVDKTTEFVTKTAEAVKNYATETINAAKANVELNRAAEIGLAQNRLLIEQFDRQAELQRQIRDDESKTIEERIAANERLGELLAEQEALMLANADAVVKAAQVQFDKLKNDENEIALLEAKAEREGVLAQIAGFRSEQLTNINSLERERQDLIQENIDLEGEVADEFIEIEQKKVAAALAAAEAKATIESSTIDTALKGIGFLKQLAGDDVGLQKSLLIAENAAGIAKILTNTAVANAKSVAASPLTGGQPFVALNTIGAGIGIASTIAATAKGLQGLNQTGLDTSGGGSVSGGGVPAAPPTPPSFNIVGASDTNQLADAIGGQTQQPVQAFVVANDVTSAQSLDRNIVEGASLG